jgi:hypothetical protein
MAAPNIRAASGTIIGKTVVAVATTSAVSVLSNAAASGKVLKINSIHLCNTSGSGNLTTVQIDSGGGQLFFQTIPPNGMVEVLAAPIYLEENHVIQLLAAVGANVVCIISYEDIS